MPAKTSPTVQSVIAAIDAAKIEQGDVTRIDGPIDRARAAAQDYVNELATRGDRVEAADAIRVIAAHEHAQWAQYDGMWDDWTLASARDRLRTKMGVAVVAHDYVLTTVRHWSDGPSTTFYSIRNRCNTAAPSWLLVPVAS